MFRNLVTRLTFACLTLVALAGVATTASAASAAHAKGAATSKVTVSAVTGASRTVSAHTVNINALPKESMSAALKAQPRQLPVRMNHPSKAGAAQNKNAPVNSTPLAASVAGATVVSGHAFPGMADSPTICPYFGGCQPPDMALASSPTRVLQGVNTSYAIYTTSGALVVGPINDQVWYGVPNPPNNCDPNGPFLSDPRAFYDPNTGLFWTATLQVESAAFGVGVNCPNTSIYWVANVNPTSGVMHVYSFDMTLGGTVNAGADYTEFGFNKDVVAFTGNMFDFTTGFFDFAEAQFANKHQMEQGLPVTSHAFTMLSATGPSGTVYVDTVQPVETITKPVADPGVEYLINSFNIFGDPFGDDCFSTACQGFVVWGYNPSTASLSGNFVNLGFNSVPNPTYISPPNADEPGCVQCVETIDTRITGTPVYSVGGGAGLISFSLDTGVNNGGNIFPNTVAGLLWGQVQVENFAGTPYPTGYQYGYLSFAGDRAASFGALMQDENGRLVMVFDTMSGTLNPSIMVASRLKADPLGTIGRVHFLVKGPSPTFDSRWGDYEAASYDGFSANHIWVASQYSVSGDWNTWIARV